MALTTDALTIAYSAGGSGNWHHRMALQAVARAVWEEAMSEAADVAHHWSSSAEDAIYGRMDENPYGV